MWLVGERGDDAGLDCAIEKCIPSNKKKPMFAFALIDVPGPSKYCPFPLSLQPPQHQTRVIKTLYSAVHFLGEGVR